MNLQNKKQVSAKAMDKLKKELDYLKKVKRKEIAEQLRHAISFGDLKENAAYHEAKEAQAFLEGKIVELNHTIKNSVITTGNGGKDIVSIGSKVTVLSGDEKESYLIVSGIESNPLEKKISSDSPMGKALMGKIKGEKSYLETPSGDRIEIEVLEID